MKVENKTIIITDPCYITKEYKDWDKCKYGTDMKKLDNITNYESSSTIYGDWSCTVYEGNIEQHSNNNKTLGSFCADAGMVAVFELDEVLKYNPNFDNHINKKFTTTTIPNFNGEITIENINNSIHVIGKGNVNFYSIQTGL
jgi:hypothetical protein